MSASMTPSGPRNKSNTASSNSDNSKPKPGTDKFPFLKTADETFCLPTYLAEQLQNKPERETELELLQCLRSNVTRPRLPDFAKCVIKWQSRGHNQRTLIKAGDIHLPLLHWVVLTASFELVDWLLGQGYDSSLKLPETDWTPLHALSLSLPWMGLCKKAKLQQTVEPIVQRLAHTLSLQDKDLATPIHIVASRVGTMNNLDNLLYETLLGVMLLAVRSEGRNGSLVMKKQNKEGNTVLHLLASKQELTKKAVSCIRAGSPLDIYNNDGDTPYDIAIRNGLNDLADYLELPSDNEDTDNNQDKPNEVTSVEEENSLSTSNDLPEMSKEGSTESPQNNIDVSVNIPGPPAKKVRLLEPVIGNKTGRRRYTRRKSASDPSSKETRPTPKESVHEVETNSQTTSSVTNKAIILPLSESSKILRAEHAAGSSASREAIDVSSIMEALVGSNVWEQLPGAASQVKWKLQNDLEGFQKEVTGRRNGHTTDSLID
jgi:ankyrin repeat protein